MIFASTLRRLTIVYSAIQLVVFGALAIGIYLFVTGTFDFDAASQDGAGAVGAAELGFMHLRIALVAGFGLLCVVVPLTSYWMARAALAPLRQSYERQQQFVDDASHELRSPLSVIRGELELALSRRRSETEYRRAIAASLEAAETLVQLTEDLLLLAQDSNIEFDSHLQPVSGDDVVRNAISAVETARATDRLTVHADAPALIDGIPALLVRAVANLLDNAMKFTPPDCHPDCDERFRKGDLFCHGYRERHDPGRDAPRIRPVLAGSRRSRRPRPRTGFAARREDRPGTSRSSDDRIHARNRLDHHPCCPVKARVFTDSLVRAAALEPRTAVLPHSIRREPTSSRFPPESGQSPPTRTTA
jgi:hypothetical protein